MTTAQVLEKYGLDHAGGCGDGWAKLLDELIADLIKLGWDRDCYQVKEKFGGLRFYIGAGSQKIWDRIDRAERESLWTCEDCGAPGKPRGGGWVRTLCDAHAEGESDAGGPLGRGSLVGTVKLR